MKKAITVMAVTLIAAVAAGVFAACGGSHSGEAEEAVYDAVLKEAEDKDGVKEITYEQFQKIRNSGEDFVLLDVLSGESYAKGHIEGAKNLPYKTINEESAAKNLSKDDHVVVYCAGFLCKASTKAAKSLGDLGYKVIDYKGGLQEWTKKGNTLAK